MNAKYKITISLLICLTLSACSYKRAPIIVKNIPQPSKGIPDKKKNYYIINNERYYPIESSAGFIQTGTASWYGADFHGKKTANGEVYDMHKKNAAHTILPFNTYVKVTNLANKKYTIVRINDRGPFVKGRIIDLSYAAAKEIDLIGPGTARVEVIALNKNQLDPGIREGTFTVQVGAFTEESNARKLAEKLRVLYDYVNITEYTDMKNRKFYRLHVSRTHTLDAAMEARKKLEELGFNEAFVIRL
ncbi:MAG: septal ring lytic transglycosylase RlpA family protein [Deltaproteobacteria bacterium]|jgi:rare lipoprotein A|nr:septal ring lytic transglycosylase RlpA family protein [Deltaproteobacteria bacterium]